MLADILAAIERLPPVGALKVSFVVYPLVNAAHILSIGMLVTAIVLMDLRLLGLFSRVERAPFVGLLRGVALAAFAGAAATGLALFSIRATEYAFNPAFQVKMGLLLVAGANVALHRRGAGNTAVARATALLSLLLWPAILVAGRFIGFL